MDSEQSQGVASGLRFVSGVQVPDLAEQQRWLGSGSVRRDRLQQEADVIAELATPQDSSDEPATAVVEDRRSGLIGMPATA